MESYPPLPPPQLTMRPLYLLDLLKISSDFQFPVLPSFPASILRMVFCQKSLSQLHQFTN